MKPEQASLTCPRCGHQQIVSRAAFSDACRKCGEYWRVQELLKPAKKAAGPPPLQKQITCFDCGTSFEVSANAQSTMCKRCSSYIDLHDYDISSAVSKNFRTKGSFVIQPNGYVFNTEAVVGEAIIKGRFLGKLIAERTLTLHSTAEIKGSLAAARLIIPASNHVRWNGELRVSVAEIEGELVASIDARTSVIVRERGRLFGAIKTRSLIVETGGVLVGPARLEPEQDVPAT